MGCFVIAYRPSELRDASLPRQGDDGTTATPKLLEVEEETEVGERRRPLNYGLGSKARGTGWDCGEGHVEEHIMVEIEAPSKQKGKGETRTKLICLRDTDSGHSNSNGNNDKR